MVSTTKEQQKKDKLKRKIEAILFSVGQRIPLEKICRLSRSKEEDALQALKELQEEYGKKDSSIEVISDGTHWKFSVHDNYQNVVRKVVTRTELSKTVLETLAVIAFRYPIKQSDLIKIRTNKAYDHLTELEETGFISRKKHGRSNLIKLTDKFFDYFNLPEEALRDKFADFKTIAAAIESKEQELEQAKQIKSKEETLEEKEARIQKEIEEMDDKVELETYGERAPKVVQVYDAPQDQDKPSSEVEYEDTTVADQAMSQEVAVVQPPEEVEEPLKDPVEELKEVIAEKKQELEIKQAVAKEKEVQQAEQSKKPEEKPPEKKTEPVAPEKKQEDKPTVQESSLELIPDPQPAPKPEPEPEQDQVVDTAPKGITLTPDMEERVDEKIERMLHPDEGQSKEESLNPLLDEDELRGHKTTSSKKEDDEEDIFADVK